MNNGKTFNEKEPLAIPLAGSSLFKQNTAYLLFFVRNYPQKSQMHIGQNVTLLNNSIRF